MLAAQTKTTAAVARRPQAASVVLPSKPRAAVVPQAAKDVVGGTAAALAAALVLTTQPALAKDNLTSLQGSVPFGRNTPAQDVGKKVLEDLPAIESSIEQQPNVAVRQAAKEVEEVLVDQARGLASETEQGLDAAKRTEANVPGITGRQAPGVLDTKVQGVQSNLAQIKSIVDPK